MNSQSTSRRWFPHLRQCAPVLRPRLPLVDAVARAKQDGAVCAPVGRDRPAGGGLTPITRTTSTTSRGVPPSAAIRISFPALKKPSSLPSADQNGLTPPAAPGTGSNATPSNARTQICCRPSSSRVPIAMLRPSRETAGLTTPAPRGRSIVNRSGGRSGISTLARAHIHVAPDAAIAAAAATARTATAACPERSAAPASASSISIRTSPADCCRLRASFTRQQCRSRWTVAGVSPGSFDQSGSARTMALSTSVMVSPSNARAPVSIS
jgi:hypothetical protein